MENRDLGLVTNPNQAELDAICATLDEFHEGPGYVNMPEECRPSAFITHVSIHHGYITGGPGYAGKIAFVLYNGAPEFFDTLLLIDNEWKVFTRDKDLTQCEYHESL